jgi:histidyl-tRNA synthetase
MESYIRETFGDAAPAVPDMLRAVDKMQKRHADEIVSEFSGYDPEKVRRILEMASTRGSPSEAEPCLDSRMRDSPAWRSVTAIIDSLHGAGIRNVQIDLGVVRGLDYYTGMVFEVFGEGDGSTALAGGGRYDMLPGAFGREMGAAGVAGGVERIVSALDRPRTGGARVAVLYANDSVFGDAARLAASLRLSGTSVRLDVAGRPLKKQMGSAKDCTTAIIVAPREMQRGDVVVRDMKAGTEQAARYQDVMDDPRTLERLVQ